MPVQSITIRATLSDGTKVEHIKPLYLCECGKPASFGQVVMRNNKRVRLWYCAEHWPIQQARAGAQEERVG
jgi:hypothetical protein